MSKDDESRLMAVELAKRLLVDAIWKTARRHHLCGITTPRTQTEPRRRAELRVTIQRVSGDAMTADLLLSEIEASLGDAWRLDVLEERNGTARIRVVLDGK